MCLVGGESKYKRACLTRVSEKNWIALEHFDVDNSPFANLGYNILFENNNILATYANQMEL